MLDVWKEKAVIRFGNVDRSDRLTLWSIFSFFQEAAISHAAELGVGRDALASTGQVWVLSRFSLFVERRPSYGETIEVSTWPRGCEKLFALRDYFIKDSGDNVLVRGRGGWLVLDIEKRRPIKIQPILELIPRNEGRDAFPDTPAFTAPPGIAPKENLGKTGERAVLYSDIDFYGHVNNARYVQWIQDVTDMDTLASADQFRLDINYLSEVMPGETVELWAGQLDGSCGNEAAPLERYYPEKNGAGFCYEGRRPSVSQPVFRAELRNGFSI